MVGGGNTNGGPGGEVHHIKDLRRVVGGGRQIPPGDPPTWVGSRGRGQAIRQRGLGRDPPTWVGSRGRDVGWVATWVGSRLRRRLDARDRDEAPGGQVRVRGVLNSRKR